MYDCIKLANSSWKKSVNKQRNYIFKLQVKITPMYHDGIMKRGEHKDATLAVL